MNDALVVTRSSAATSRRPTVLLLDDDPAVLGSLRRLLRTEPYDVVTTAHPDEALARLAKSSVDVVIADALMPSMSGVTFLKLVEEGWPDTARLIVSGHPGVAESVRSQRPLVQHFIPKPWKIDELRSLLRSLVAPHDAASAGAPRRGSAVDFMVERPLLIDCTRRRLEEVSPNIYRFLQKACAAGKDVVAVFEGLGAIESGATGLLSELVLGVHVSGVRLHLLDSSGSAGVFFQNAEAFHPRIRLHAAADEQKKLLLVDPVASRRVFLKLLFSSMGHVCRAVADPEEARKVFETETFDLVLLELSRAEDDEINLVRELARRESGTGVIPLLAVPRTWSPVIARRWNLQRPLVRPYRFLDLVDAVR
jgi:DNA-binding NtrC family response regulator